MPALGGGLRLGRGVAQDIAGHQEGVGRRASYVVGVTATARLSLACLQAALGLAAHVAAAGCLPQASVLILLLPLLVLSADAASRLLRTVPRWVALVAGQCLVHVVLSVAAGCAAAAAGVAHPTALRSDVPFSAPVMAPAHVVALVVCVAAASYVDRTLQVAHHLSRHAFPRLRAAVALLLQPDAPVAGLPCVPAPAYEVAPAPPASPAQQGSRAPPRRVLPALAA